MGSTIWLQIKRDGKATGGDRDNSIMLRLDKELDVLATDLGVATPSSYFGVWSDSSAGLETISTLLSALEADPSRLSTQHDPARQHWRQMLLEELRYCADGLREGSKEGLKFRFRIVA